MSINWPSAASPAPSLLALPPAAASLDEAFAAIELWEFYKGRKLDEGQKLDVCVMLATRADGMFATGLTGHEKPRQSGKGDAIEVVEFWGLVQRAERILHTIHDAVLLATETHSRMLSLLEGHGDLKKLVRRAWKGTGQQMIEMRNGGQIWYRTRTGSGGRGVDEVDRVVVDEAQHAELQHLASITPTQAVSENPQLNALGTGGLDGKSAWWWSLRKQAKRGASVIGWVGWSAQRWDVDDKGQVELFDVDPYDRDLWWATIPGLNAGRTSIEFLERELAVLGPTGFAQEYLCVWAAPPDEFGQNRLIPADVWAKCGPPKGVMSTPDNPWSWVASHDQWSVTISPDRRWASFGIAGRNADGLYHVECFDRRVNGDWVYAVALEIWKQKRVPARIHKTGPENGLIAKFRELGIEVAEVSSADVAAATGQFIDDANAGRLVHLNDPRLNKALEGAELRTGSDGAALWSQRNSSVEITPLMACTVALGGVPQEAPAEFVSLIL